jgi:hypothetical protein
LKIAEFNDCQLILVKLDEFTKIFNEIWWSSAITATEFLVVLFQVAAI